MLILGESLIDFDPQQVYNVMAEAGNKGKQQGFRK